MKLFVAIEVPAALEPILATWSDVVGAENWRRVEPSLMHITLRFLGDVPDEKLDGLTAALAVVAGRRAPFTLQLEGVGTFGSAARPRVLWAGVREDPTTRPLTSLANDVDVSIDPVVAAVVGARDRPFAAHLTLGRAKAKPTAKVAHPERATQLGALEMRVDELVLFDSAPSPSQPTYTAVWRRRLGAGSQS